MGLVPKAGNRIVLERTATPEKGNRVCDLTSPSLHFGEGFLSPRWVDSTHRVSQHDYIKIELSCVYRCSLDTIVRRETYGDHGRDVVGM
jgi:hypothetical protein